MRNNQHLGLALAISATLASPSVFATNGYFAHGYGAKSKGVAGAGIALSQDALTIASNPAGLTAVPDQVYAGLDWFKPVREATIEGNAFGADDSFSGNGEKEFYVPEIAYSQHLTTSLVGGIALYGNGGMNTEYEENPYARFGATGKAGVDFKQVFIAPALAWQINEQHSIGAAINFAYQRFKATGIAPFAGMSSAPAYVSDNGYDDTHGWGARLGWTGRFGDILTLGASWQSKIKTGGFRQYRGLFAEQGGFDIPENYGVGLAIKLHEQVTAVYDWQKIEYSGIASVGNSISEGGPLGADNGAGFGWEDSEVSKLGLEYRINKQFALRAGYSYGSQPIPEGETFFNILAPGIITRHATLGGSWAIDNTSEISFHYTHGFEETVRGKKSIAPGMPPAGMGGGEADITMKQDIFGIGYTYQL